MFLKDETGAVTVDWVVITASLVGLGLATMTMVSGGLEDASSDIEEELRRSDILTTTFDAVAAVLAPVTAGFTATRTVEAGGRVLLGSSTSQLSFRMDATLGADTNGILWEAGGTGRGTILYQHDGTLYLQSGRGNGYGELAGSNGRGEAAWTIQEGARTIEGSVDANGGLALYVDGRLVDQSSFTATSLTGGNEGAVGEGRSSVSVNRGGYNRQTARHAGAGTLYIYEGALTGDESGG
jgi:hypothetical protein